MSAASSTPDAAMPITLHLKYLHEDVSRHGQVRLYFRRGPGQPKVRIRETPGSAAFHARYHELLRLSAAELPVATAPAPASRPQLGTLRWLVAAYVGSEHCRQLDPATQRVRRQILEHCCREPVTPETTTTFATFPLDRLDTRALRVLRDRKSGLPEAQNGRVRALRALFSWATEAGLVAHNPARDLARISNRTAGWHTWTVDEVRAFETHHPIGSMARLALALILYTGARRSDAVAIGRQHIRDGWLRFRPHKGRKRSPQLIEIPVLPELATVLSASPAGDLTLLLNGNGRPFSIAGFGNWFRDRCDEAGLRHCSAHGLRKAGATIAAEAGATSQQLMAIYGWRALAEAETYTRAADRRRLAAAGMQHIASIKSRP